VWKGFCLTIPASVKSIGSGAFASCTGLISISIPASVTSIGEAVFNGCAVLTSITVDTKNKNYSSVEGVLFNKKRTVLVSYPAGIKGNYTIPAGVTSIGNSTFRGCTGLTSITIPASVKSIGWGAFSGCQLPRAVRADIIKRFGEEPEWG